ncbi:MAG: cation:proton antiporter [Deltaproteobacteria bacterium]|nr:cation:proton antiporter [Deltaproteobacteria bacterium]
MSSVAPIKDLAVILSAAALVTLLFRKLRQPVVLGYILAGILISPKTSSLHLISDLSNTRVWADLGVIFLMYSVGLEFTFQKLVRVGLVSLITALIEILSMGALGFLCGRWLGWPLSECIVLAGMLSISSTTVIVKALDELGLKTKRFAEVVYGVLVVEDLVAILFIVSLSMLTLRSIPLSSDMLFASLKLFFVIVSWFLAGYFLVPSFLRYTNRLLDSETLVVFSTGFCLCLAVMAASSGYSLVLGAFIMGSILAASPLSERIGELIRPLRDLFVAIFFVTVGMMVDMKALGQHPEKIVFLAVITVACKGSAAAIGALTSGESIHNALRTGLSLAQIGEFSFIIAGLGYSLGLASESLFTMAVAISAITSFTAPYSIRFSEKVAQWADKVLPDSLKNRLAAYAAWVRRPGDRFDRRQFYRRLLRFVLNGVLVTLVFQLVKQYGLPFLEGWMTKGASLSAVVLSFLLASPFIWGMFFAFRPKVQLIQDTPLLEFYVCEFLTVIWLGLLTDVFLQTAASFLITLTFLVILFLSSRAGLEKSYRWFEGQLLSNLTPSASEQTKSLANLLAPWDLHLVRVKVHPNSQLAGLALVDAGIRVRYGVNVVIIHRGVKAIVNPEADERLYPGDELLVLGTDEQIDSLRDAAEGVMLREQAMRRLSDYSLKRLFVGDSNLYAGQRLRDSGLREIGALVVGLERGSYREINPAADTLLKQGDVLWIVSDKD